jgi:replicative DNA helicase
MSEFKPLSPEDQIKATRELIEIKKKELEIKKYNTDARYQEILETQEQLRAMSELDIINFDPSYIQKLEKKSSEYHKGSKIRSEFILGIPEFNSFVPFFPKNLIVIGAVTGEGKSTACANVAYSLLMQGKKPLIITNEESAEDVYNRVAALFMGIRYGNHDKLSEDKVQKMHELMPKLYTRMRVIDDAFGQMSGKNLPSTTTSIEGLELIMSKLLEAQSSGVVYDCIIIDYFQNFSESKKAPSLDIVKVLTKVSTKLDQFKNAYNAPIVVFAQLKPNPKDSEVSAKERMEWCKGLINKATCFLEMRAVKKDSATAWIIHKSRWNDYPEHAYVTGWLEGKYVLYSEEFKRKIAEKKLRFLEKKEMSDGTS